MNIYKNFTLIKVNGIKRNQGLRMRKDFFIFPFLFTMALTVSALNRHYLNVLQCDAYDIGTLSTDISVREFCSRLCPARFRHCQRIVKEQCIAQYLIKEERLRKRLYDIKDVLDLFTFAIRANTLANNVSLSMQASELLELYLLQIYLYDHLAKVQGQKGMTLLMERMFLKVAPVVHPNLKINVAQNSTGTHYNVQLQ